MTKNGKEASKQSKNGHRKKINGNLYLLTEESNENDKKNGEWQDRKEQLKMARTKKEGKMYMKPFVETEDRKKNWRTVERERRTVEDRKINEQEWQKSNQNERKCIKREEKCKPLPN